MIMRGYWKGGGDFKEHRGSYVRYFLIAKRRTKVAFLHLFRIAQCVFNCSHSTKNRFQNEVVVTVV